MATSILSTIYKEAAATSKGVVQMNRTLNKIYDNQEKSNNRQDKFVSDLRTKQKREEREEKKRQSDLKKAIAGISSSRAKEDKEKDSGFDFGGAGGLVSAVVSGLGVGLKVFQGLLIAALTKKFANFFRGGNRGQSGGPVDVFTPPSRGGNRGRNRGGNRSGTRLPPESIDPPGGRRNQGGRNQGGRNQSGRNGVGSRGGNVPGVVTPPTKTPTPPAKAPWWKRLWKGAKNWGGKLLGPLKKWAGPLLSLAFMAEPMYKMYTEKRYKDLARYVISAVAGGTVGSIAQSLVLGLAALAGAPTGGTGGVAVFLAGMGAAIGAGNYAANEVDKILYHMGLADEDQSTGQVPDASEAHQSIQENSALIEGADKADPSQLKQASEVIQKRQKGGGIFDVPGHGQGDTVPMMLPPGAFVLNRVAAQEMFARGGSPSGLVPTLLEPGEKVFMPGDPLMDMAMSFNSSYSRFQQGGMVGGGADQPAQDTSGEKTATQGEDRNIGSGGSQAVLTIGKMLQQQGFTVKEHPNFAGRQFDPEGKARVGGHSKNSLHYQNLAIDVTDWREGNWQQRTAELAEAMYKKRDEYNLTQIIHDPWGSWFAGESQKGPAYGGHPTHLHLGFAKGPVGDKGFVGEGGPDTPQNEQEEQGMFAGLTNALSPITNLFSGLLGEDGPISKISGMFSDALKGAAAGIQAEMNSPETKQMMDEIGAEMKEITDAIQREMSGEGSQQISRAPTPSAQSMDTIRQMMDPEQREQETVVQVVSGGREPTPTIEGEPLQNLPPGLTVRCSSWASADYRYDRSLNTATL